ncbi:uncharacterized protein PAC_16526 [Phialocephala subalpina]|uniref:Uncharacterized protein n=1 Tax=Phialocephala subalpina TaxID=576137 RepID=A0A1L7XNK1_9HELO|nr:uncharacterized protein PAC_16526 [Phialocephala subalpina]
MSTSSIQAQWSLSSTSQTVLSIAREVLAAATSDSVQVLAILACERFGSTVAVSSKTASKVEHVLVPTPEPAPISFLKAFVGFSSNDCATQLGQSAAGIRFLGLAAALTTTVGLFESAQALDIMLKASTADLSLLPSVRHLKDLLGSIEARSYRCGFADSVVAWQIILRAVLRSIFSEGSQQNLDESSAVNAQSLILKAVPSPEAIAGLVDVFRQVARMGCSTVTGATIRVGEAAPWVLAFAQWSLDIPPSVYVEGKGAVLEEPRSRVKVIVSTAPKDIRKPLEATIHYQLENLTQLLGPASQHSTNGMVKIETYGRLLLQEFGFEDGMLRLLREALEYAIPQVLSQMKCGRFTRLGRNANYNGRFGSINSVDDCRLSPVPDIRVIEKICSMILAIDGPIRFASLDRGMILADLPLISRHLESLMEKCLCDECQAQTGRHAEPVSQGYWCKKYAFFRSISFVIMDIFALSLFDSPASLLISLNLNERDGIPMDSSISEAITTGNPQKYDDMDLLKWARSMVGHKFDEEDEGWIMTYCKGQVIYPTIFDTFHLEKQGYLRLCWLPGTLRYQGETFDAVSTPYSWIDTKRTQYAGLNLPPCPEVSRPLNLFRNFELSWEMAIQDNKKIHARLAVRSSGEIYFKSEADPTDILYHLRNTLILENCPHDHDAQLTSVDRFASYTSPWHEYQEASNSTSHVDIIAADRANELRLFALAFTREPTVLRRNSCIRCCLNLCRDAGVHVLIL